MKVGGVDYTGIAILLGVGLVGYAAYRVYMTGSNIIGATVDVIASIPQAVGDAVDVVVNIPFAVVEKLGEGRDLYRAWYNATGGALRPGQTQAQAIEEWANSLQVW
jgi:hypothetical protein